MVSGTKLPPKEFRAWGRLNWLSINNVLYRESHGVLP